ncbi:MAG: tRNA (N(6)-L-threonylcarbamoyladenosine(37)-C(2))-methylthiotransferase MtaB [Lachnospiraceae bacterium]|nr:tRNA (N(6)-L-threonylcarbamoyladenosine(37)-C(2))-methylthiotransferase MtaB [Lachnospiraceae bacterium]
MKKAALHNLGCKVNAYETEAMRQSLEEHGYEIVQFNEKADIYIINTCTVTNMADRKSRQMLHRAKKLNPDAVVVAVGCYVQAAGESLKDDQAIDIIIGNNHKADLVDILDAYFETKENTVILDDLSKGSQYEDMEMTTLGEHTRAFVKIQDGCNQFCTYCIIPYARGRIRSRSIDDIRYEIPKLAACGYKEIVLTGIHLSSYGRDMEGEKLTLLDAIKEVCSVEGIERVRLGSLEPRIISEEFLEELSGLKEFCPHFHLSLQSGCEETLKRMNRHYTPGEYLEKCKMIRKVFPMAAITTDVIVGFPGESDEEFITTREFLEEVSFAEMHIFKYSKRAGTVAAKMDGQIREEIKTDRSDELIALGARLRGLFVDQFVGMNVDVLVEEQIDIDGEKYMTGHTKEYVKVIFKADEAVVNTIVRVDVTKNLNNEILLANIGEM